MPVRAKTFGAVLAWILTLSIAGCISRGCSPAERRCEAFQFVRLPIRPDTREAFLALSPKEQVEAYPCAVDILPSRESYADLLAQQCTETVPVIVARLHEDHDDLDRMHLIYALSELSQSCRLPDILQTASVDAAEAAFSEMRHPWARQRTRDWVVTIKRRWGQLTQPREPDRRK